MIDRNALDSFISFYGKQKIFHDINSTKVEVISTDCPPLDYITGVGGIPRGRIVELSGHESSGKTTVALQLCEKELSRNPDSLCVILDYERTITKEYLETLQLAKYVVENRFLVFRPDTIGQGDEVVREMFAKKLCPAIIVVDSVPAMTPMKAFESRDEDSSPQPGLQARGIADLLPRWSKYAADHNTTFLLLNQLRAYISMNKFDHNKGIPGLPGSDKDVTPGGRALPFYCSLRIRLAVKKVLAAEVANPMSGEIESRPFASVVRAITWKNKCAEPYRSALFYIEFGRGIDSLRTLVELALIKDLGGGKFLIQKSARGGYYSIEMPHRVLKSQGEKKFIDALRDDREAQEYLKKVLQWDSAEAIGKEQLNVVTLDIDTGMMSNDTKFELKLGKGLTLAQLSQASSIYEQGLLLGLIEEESGTGYTFDGEEDTYRVRELEKFELRVSVADKKYLVDEVTRLIKRLEKLESEEVSKSKEEAPSKELLNV